MILGMTLTLFLNTNLRFVLDNYKVAFNPLSESYRKTDRCFLDFLLIKNLLDKKKGQVNINEFRVFFFTICQQHRYSRVLFQSQLKSLFNNQPTYNRCILYSFPPNCSFVFEEMVVLSGANTALFILIVIVTLRNLYPTVRSLLCIFVYVQCFLSVPPSIISTDKLPCKFYLNY